jgi:hypothetical protein
MMICRYFHIKTTGQIVENTTLDLPVFTTEPTPEISCHYQYIPSSAVLFPNAITRADNTATIRRMYSC